MGRAPIDGQSQRHVMNREVRPWIVHLGLYSLLCSQVQASDVHLAGKLVDMRREGTGSGALRAQGTFCFAVELQGIAYLSRREAYWRWSYEPTDFVVGDPVEVRINGNTLFLKKPHGGELKTSIIRRERSDADKDHLNCGIPVAFR